MKLITLTVTVNDFRDHPTDDASINKLLSSTLGKIEAAVDSAAEKFDIVLTVDRD